MQEIENHLENGKSSGELIDMGYKPATVYKTQRGWRVTQEHQEGYAADQLDEGVVALHFQQ